MKKLIILLSILTCCSILEAKTKGTKVSMDEVWKEFRANHPYGFQTVALKHNGDENIFVISEPSERVSYQAIEGLFGRYGGNVTIKKDSLGYDGWLADVVGSIKFKSKEQETEFQRELFSLLYGTDYKGYYTDLDKPSRHSYFAPYKYKLNYSITAAELKQWFIDEKEVFGELSEQGVLSAEKPLTSYLSTAEKNPNKLLFSHERGFVVWLINPSRVSDDKSFMLNARKFALDTDLIIGAFGVKGKTVAIVARERQVPVSILPPLRIETLTLLATTNNESLAQSYERHNVFASKLPNNEDVAPIYLSDELWHTEYGNLLNVTDQMLKSWSENGNIEYKHFNHPKPIDWAFDRGAVRDLEAKQLTYNWNTAGAGYVIEGDDYDIFAVNRTGSLPVSYIPGGMEGRVEQKVYDAEELAYDFFSGLNSPELARVVQYATFYQIFSYFKGDNNALAAKKQVPNSSVDNVVPDYSVFDGYVEKLLNIAQKATLSKESDDYQSALSRFSKRYRDNNAHTRLKQLLENDPYGEFADYLQQTSQREHFDSLLQYPPTDEEIEEAFQEYLNPNLDTIRSYIRSYEKTYGMFPVKDAARYIVSPREIETKINEANAKKPSGIVEYESRVDRYNHKLDSLKRVASALSKEIDEYNNRVVLGTANSSDRVSLELRQTILNEEFKKLDIERKSIDKQEAGLLQIIAQNNKEVDRLLAIMVNDSQQKALGALNWLLTDPTPYSESSGVFYASRLTTHGQWMKSPSMACSTNSFGYGGHNLDAHVTPIKSVVGLGKNKCRISFEKGKRVISVAKENMARVTRSFLRKVERQINTAQIIDLPDPPKNHDKSYFVAANTLKEERGFCEAFNSDPEHISRSLTIKGYNGDIKNENEFYAAVKNLDEIEGEITIVPYSEGKCLVKHGENQCIIDRSENFDYGEYVSSMDVSSNYEGEALRVELKKNFADRKGIVQQATILTFPDVLWNNTGKALESVENRAAKIVEAIKSYPNKIGNWLKLMHHIKKSIDEDGLYQDLHMDVKSSLYNLLDVLQENNPHVYILFEKDENDVLYILAA